MMDNKHLLDATTRLAFFAYLHDLGKLARRDKQSRRVITNTVGRYGEMSGILGGSLPKIPALTLEGTAPLLEELA